MYTVYVTHDFDFIGVRNWFTVEFESWIHLQDFDEMRCNALCHLLMSLPTIGNFLIVSFLCIRQFNC